MADSSGHGAKVDLQRIIRGPPSAAKVFSGKIGKMACSGGGQIPLAFASRIEILYYCGREENHVRQAFQPDWQT
jgi:hypothetical protein